MFKRMIVMTMVTGILAVGFGSVQADDRVTSSTDRLFLSFAEEATYTDGQWWEGQLQVIDGDQIDALVLRGIMAFKILDRVEVGGTVGFADTDGPGDFGGNGATDLDAWGKYHFGGFNPDTEFAVGTIVTVPTGDESDGLGTDAFAFAGFGSVRYRLNRMILGGDIGARVNGDGALFGGPSIDGKTSLFVGASVIAPLSDRVSAIGEFRWEDARFEGADDDTRLLGGLNWRVSNRGQFRAALGLGLTNGAPDAQAIFGFASQF